MVADIRSVATALGDGVKIPRPSELNNVRVARKSLVAARAIKAGELFAADNVTAKRPGAGRSPFDYWELIGQAASRDLSEDEPIP